MLPKNLFYLLAALMVILWAGQPLQAQSTPEIPLKKKACDGLWPVDQGKKWGYIDNTGRLVIPFKSAGIAGEFSEGLAAVTIKGKCGYIDQTGQFVIPPRFASGYPFADGMALVVLHQPDRQETHRLFKLGYIDRSGKVVFQHRKEVTAKELAYTSKEMAFSEGLARVEQNDKFGYIDKTGRQVIPPRYTNAQPFCEGLAAVSIADKYGYIDRSGKMVIAPRFKHAGPFAEGLAPVNLDTTGEQGGGLYR